MAAMENLGLENDGPKSRAAENDRTGRKAVEKGHWLLLITNGKSQVAERSVLIPMTLSLSHLDRDQSLPVDLRNYG